MTKDMIEDCEDCQRLGKTCPDCEDQQRRYCPLKLSALIAKHGSARSMGNDYQFELDAGCDAGCAWYHEDECSMVGATRWLQNIMVMLDR